MASQMMQKFNLIVNLEWQWTLAFIWFPFPSKRKSKKHLHWQSEKKNFRHKLPKLPLPSSTSACFHSSRTSPIQKLQTSPPIGHMFSTMQGLLFWISIIHYHSTITEIWGESLIGDYYYKKQYLYFFYCSLLKRMFTFTI